MNPTNDSISASTPTTMSGVQLIGHGGLDQLVYRQDIPTPQPKEGEVLLKVLAAGVNNTDINTVLAGTQSKLQATLAVLLMKVMMTLMLPLLLGLALLCSCHVFKVQMYVEK